MTLSIKFEDNLIAAKEDHRERVIREMSESLKLTEEKTNSRVLVSNIKLKKGEVSNEEMKRRWLILLEDIVNINYNNRAEIFQFMLDKLNKQKNYFFCGFDLFYLNNFNTNLIDSKTEFNVEESNKKNAKEVGWQPIPSLNRKRANFSAIVHNSKKIACLGMHL